MKILISGGNGFIGSYLTNALIKKGHQVYNIDKFLNFTDNGYYYQKILKLRTLMFSEKPIKTYDADIRKPRELKNVFSDCKPEIVVHLAAITMARPPKKFEHLLGPINLNGTLNMLTAFENTPSAKRFIFPSSSLAYGHFVKNPQPEESFLNPIGEYGIMKAASEYIIRMTKKEWVILRPTSIYGFTDCANRVTQLLFDAAIDGKPAWVVKDEAMDFTYIDDAVDGFVRAIEKPQAKNQIFNISRGKSRTAEDFAAIVKKYFPNFYYEVKPKSKNVVVRWTQDIRKANRIIGFKPDFDIEDGIRKTYRLMKKYGQI